MRWESHRWSPIHSHRTHTTASKNTVTFSVSGLSKPNCQSWSAICTTMMCCTRLLTALKHCGSHAPRLFLIHFLSLIHLHAHRIFPTRLSKPYIQPASCVPYANSPL